MDKKVVIGLIIAGTIGYMITPVRIIKEIINLNPIVMNVIDLVIIYSFITIFIGFIIYKIASIAEEKSYL